MGGEDIMPRISSFMYCTSDTNTQNEMLSYIKPDFIPGNYTFYAAFSIVDLYPEKTFLLRVEFRDPDDQIVFSTDDQKLEGPNKDGKQHVGALINFTFKNVPLKKEGLYTTSVCVNDVSLGTFSIPVYKGSEEDE